MMKHEFEELVGYPVSNDDYKVIEMVYMYHPAIREYGGKDQIATLYKICGMPLINSMVQEAKEAMEDEQKRKIMYHECVVHINSIVQKVQKLALQDENLEGLNDALEILKTADEIIGLDEEGINQWVDKLFCDVSKHLEEVLK